MRIFQSLRTSIGIAYRGCWRDGWLLPVSLAIPFVTLVAMFAYPPFVVSIERRISLSAQPDIQYIIAEHLQKLTLVASDLSRSSTVHRYLRSAGNDELLSALAADETQVRKVGNIIFADAYGFTRGQSILTLRRGGHLPRVTRWGSALARQGSVAMVSTCPVAPLLLVSGASVWSET